MKAKKEKRLGLKAARIKKDITQDQIANKLKVSQQTYSGWESGKRLPNDIETIKELEKILDTPRSDLFPEFYN